MSETEAKTWEGERDRLSEMDKEALVCLTAIDTVTAYLEKAFIVDGCRVHPTVGCASCQAIDLQRQLLTFGLAIREDAPGEVVWSPNLVR